MSTFLSKMPWASAQHSEEQEEAKQSEEEGESLTTVLQTQDDRSALTILVADCTAVMRQSIEDIFDAEQPGKGSDKKTPDQGPSKPEIDQGTANAAKLDKQKREMEQREKELSGPKMQELKTAALKYFDDWRHSVIDRVGEVVNSRQAAQEHKEESQPAPVQRRTSSPIRYRDPPEHDPGVSAALQIRFPPVKNSLKELPEEKRALILHSVLLLMLSLEHYQAYSRTLMLHLTTSLGLSVRFLANDESKIARGLLAAAENLKADEETKKKAEENQGSRKWKVGLATVAGAALIGVTGGLAAPLLAAGVGSVMGGLGLGATAAAGYLGSVAGSTVIVGGLFGAYGGRMTGQMMDQYAREVSDFGFVAVRTHHKPRKIEKEFRRLRVCIGISGWLTNKDDVIKPWRIVGVNLETFALRFELEALMNLGNAMTSMVTSAAWGYAKSEIIKRTVFASLTAGLWPLALLKVSRVIDNPWSVANYRAQKAGEVLADAIINKAQGERPVTLVGYGLGAKVIYTCLHNLAERKAFGLVESAVLIGSPTPSTPADWRMIRSVVAGRIVNVYSTNDYILAFLYRSSSFQYGVAGLQAIEGVKSVENVDVSDTVSSHTRYRYLTGRILRRIGFEDVDAEEFAREEKELKEEEEKEEKKRKESEKKEDEAPGTAKKAVGGADAQTSEVSDESIKDLEKEIEQKNEQSYIGWAQESMTAAGTNAAVAYEKAKMQWNLRSQGARGQAAASAAGQVDSGTSDASNTASKAGIDAPTAGDVAVQGTKASSG